MYFWLIIIVLVGGLYQSYFVYRAKWLPLLISVLGITTATLMSQGIIGFIGLTVLAILALIIWGANMIEDKR
jgi:nicotinamide riboside transporter PnuC